METQYRKQKNKIKNKAICEFIESSLTRQIAHSYYKYDKVPDEILLQMEAVPYLLNLQTQEVNSSSIYFMGVKVKLY